MITDCLDNLIGIDHGCTQVTPVSNLYMQQLPMVTIRVADAAASEEDLSGVSMLEEVIQFSQRAMVQDLREFLSPKVRANSVIENDTVGKYREDLDSVVLQAGQFKGIEVVVDDFPYLDFYISSIKLQLADAITTDVFVYDVMTGILLDTLPITTVANVPTQIVVNRSYKTDKQRLHLFIGIDSGLSNTFNTGIYESLVGCKKCGRTFRGNRYVRFAGVQISQALQILDDNFTSLSNTNGLSLDYSLSCEIDPLLCNMAGQLGWVLLHKAGAELMRRLQFNDRLNSYVTVHGADVEKLREEFSDEYSLKMQSIIDNIQLPKDICFDCPKRVNKVTVIP